ncbi:PAS domain-containing sensor histidine kinase [Betaproteobacteria bacterium]|nr:PAS domain-containing sensor histidine kinase [Betaproteobacteria bacterium]GHU02730.1 PAS domain-containing sensor histidine kinase [Betaproteobacteria bacterium]GHU21664.1 PAS domain-containing sensor histidine kinase [Betaproteobacteria bacterium]
MKRIAFLIIAAALAGISLYLLTSASANSGLFSDYYPWLLAVNGVIAVVLATMVGVQLRGLWREYRAQRFGSRLKSRIVVMFALMALLPGMVVYAVSLHFVVRSIESWFDVRVDSALEGGIALGQNALDYLVGQLRDKANDMALDLENRDNVSATQLGRLRELASIDSVTLIGSTGQVVAATADDNIARLLPDLPSPPQLREARQRGSASLIDNSPDGRLIIRVIVSVPSRHLADEAILLQLTQLVPKTFSQHVDAVQEAWRDYQQLTLGRSGLKLIYTLTLTLTLLLALLTAMAAAFILARRLTAPLQMLAEGTQAVAQGDFSQRQALPARDEFGMLTQSFSQMTRQLDEAREQADRNHAAVEAARGYLESVLANLSTGVLAFSADGRLRAANHGAMTILDDKLEGFEHITIADWSRHVVFRDVLLDRFAAHEGDWHTELEIPRADKTPLTLLVHGSRLPADTGGGLVVVFDDISRLIEAQRATAWGEAARRLAHEIKNPLTPIQLSAERLAFKLSSQLDEPGRQMLERSTTTIVNQVEAVKNLVNAFRDYARLPAPVLAPLELGTLIREVLHLYESASVPIVFQLAADLPQVLGDASQIRQIIHNMLQNAQDVLTGRDDGEIVLAARSSGEMVELVCRDNGAGFPVEVLARAFTPYFTTKAKGTGLGLAMIKKIVTEHGGEVKITNRDGGGAEISIRLRPVTPHTANANQDGQVTHR